ncbi:MAG: transglutaminase-like domain-containing protein [Nanoarchaeota archaeon]|nr:transglutaminase-like domain-containing protein [Nanoarchaeota archaeon]
MTAFEQIKDSLEMTALVRSAVTDNTEEVSLKHDLTMEEYTLFKKMYVNDPYSTIGHMNAFMGRMRNNYNVMDHHVDAALELECLVEEEDLRENIEFNSEIKCEIPGFVSQGYRALWNDGRDTGRSREKVIVDKRTIKGTLKIAKLFAIGNKDDEEKTLKDIARYLQSILKYDLEFIDAIAEEKRDVSVMINLYETVGKAICRHHALFYQLAVQEAGIPAKMIPGQYEGRQRGHMWGKAKLNRKSAILDLTNYENPVIISERLINCYEKAKAGYAKKGINITYIPWNPRTCYYKYSTRGLQ